MSSLIWARPDALWLLLLAPLLAAAGYWFGVRSGRLRPGALGWRTTVVVLLVIGLADPLVASGASSGGVVFVVDRSASIAAPATDIAERWLAEQGIG